MALIAWEKDATPVPVAFKNFPFPAVYAANKEQFSLDASILLFASRRFRRRPMKRSRKRSLSSATVPRFSFRPRWLEQITVRTATKQTGWLRIPQATSTDADSRDYEIAARQISIVAGTYAVIFKILMAAMVPAIFLLVLMRRSTDTIRFSIFGSFLSLDLSRPGWQSCALHRSIVVQRCRRAVL